MTDAFFAAPVMLSLLGLVTLLGLSVFLVRRRSAVPMRSVLALPEQSATWRTRLWALPEVLRLLALAAVVVALAGPLVVQRVSTVTRFGVDVLLLVDVSESMGALDVPPNRLGAARQFAHALTARHPRDRFGVLAFASRTLTMCPLTTDHAAVGEALDALGSVDLLAESRTALGAAVVNAVARLSAGAARGSSPVIVLLSDGGVNEETVDPREAAALASRAGVRVHTVAVGQSAETQFPTEIGLVTVNLPVNETWLRSLATATGGSFYSDPDDSALLALSADIARQERPAPVVTAREEPVNLFRFLAAMAFGLLLLELVGRVVGFVRWP